MTEKTDDNKVRMDEMGRNIQPPNEWAEWLFETEERRKLNGTSYTRTPEELAKWIAGLAGEDTPERLLAFLNLPEVKLDNNKKEELIRKCCENINKNPDRPFTALAEGKTVSPEVIRNFNEGGEKSPYKQFRPESLLERLIGHPSYKQTKTSTPTKLPVKV